MIPEFFGHVWFVRARVNKEIINRIRPKSKTFLSSVYKCMRGEMRAIYDPITINSRESRYEIIDECCGDSDYYK